MKTTYTKSRPETIFQLLTFTFDPFFNVKWGYLTTKTLCLLWFSIITDSKVGDNRCGSGLVFTSVVRKRTQKQILDREMDTETIGVVLHLFSETLNLLRKWLFKRYSFKIIILFLLILNACSLDKLLGYSVILWYYLPARCKCIPC